MKKDSTLADTTSARWQFVLRHGVLTWSLAGLGVLPVTLLLAAVTESGNFVLLSSFHIAVFGMIGALWAQWLWPRIQNKRNKTDRTPNITSEPISNRADAV